MEGIPLLFPGVAGCGDPADDNSSSALTASVEVNNLGGVKGIRVLSRVGMVIKIEHFLQRWVLKP